MNNNDMVSRLIKYKKGLTQLKSLGIVKVFSDNLGDTAGVSSAQVRKDFSSLNIQGNKRGGYQIDELITKLTEILGDNKGEKIIVVGCGNIGSALFNHFSNTPIKIVAGFDDDPSKVDPHAPIPIFPIDGMVTYVKSNGIKAGIIAVPESIASEIYDKMKSAGIKGFLNFANTHLREEGTVVNNIDIELKVENLFYKLNRM